MAAAGPVVPIHLVPIHLAVVAGGRGLRAGGGPQDPPKQFRLTGRGPLFMVGLQALLDLDPARGFAVAGVAVAAPEAWREFAAEALHGLDLPWRLAPAGTTRTASVFNALSALAARSGPTSPRPADLVAIHDAARPFATADLLQRLAEAARRHGAAVPGVPVTDTIVAAGGAAVADTQPAPARYLERTGLLAVQTPQVFRWQECWEAHRWAAETGADFTDDGGLLAARGTAPVVVPGEAGNWKVTTEADWLRAEAALRVPRPL